MRNAWQIARVTVREAYRRRLAWLGAGLGAAFLLVYGVGLHYIALDISRYASGTAMFADTGFGVVTTAAYYVVAFLGSVLGVLLGAGSLSVDIASHAIQAVAARPIRRAAIVLGKWLGYAGIVATFVLAMSAGVTGVTWLVTQYTAPNLAQVMALLVLEAVIMLSVSLAGSTRLSTMAASLVGLMLYGLGFVGGWIEIFGTEVRNQAAMDVGVISSLIVPSEAMWKRASYLVQPPLMTGIGPFSVGAVPSVAMVVYALVYVAACVGLAVHLFGTRDL